MYVRLPPEIRKKQIINGAVRVLYTKGYRAFSKAAVIEEASVASGQVYHYFECLNDVLDQAVEHIIDLWRKDDKKHKLLDETFQDVDENPIEYDPWGRKETYMHIITHACADGIPSTRKLSKKEREQIISVLIS